MKAIAGDPSQVLWGQQSCCKGLDLEVWFKQIIAGADPWLGTTAVEHPPLSFIWKIWGLRKSALFCWTHVAVFTSHRRRLPPPSCQQCFSCSESWQILCILSFLEFQLNLPHPQLRLFKNWSSFIQSGRCRSRATRVPSVCRSPAKPSSFPDWGRRKASRERRP